MSDRASNGRFTDGNRAASVRKAKSAPGSTGVRSYGGYVDTGERDRALQGAEKWVTYANAFAFPPVAIAALLRYALISGAKWTLAPNKAGGRDAERGMEIVQEGLLDARFEDGQTTWDEVAAKASMSYFNGSSLHAFALGRRKDGMVVFSDIGHRPMHTIEKWWGQGRRDVTPFVEVDQRLTDGRTVPIPLAECLYMREQMLGDDPYGTGVLRLVVERIRRAGRYEALEGSELFSSLGGLPIYRAPLEEIEKNAPKDPAKRDAYIAEAVRFLETALTNRIKTPEKQQYLGLDSKPYTGADPNMFTSTQKWAIEIVKGELQGLVDVRKVITDLHLDVARVLHVEFVYVGGGDSAGTYGMHESKVSSFVKMTQTGLNRLGVAATHQLARRQVAANGLDPDTATPTVVPEQITIQSVLDTVAMLEGIARAGLHPADPARNILREQRGLPPEPEDEIQADLMAPRRPVSDDDLEDEEDVGDLEDDEPKKPDDIEPTDEKEPKKP